MFAWIYQNGFVSCTQMQAPKTDGPRQKRKFSTYFKSLVIELDRELYGPDNHLVEVHYSSDEGDTILDLVKQNVKYSVDWISRNY